MNLASFGRWYAVVSMLAIAGYCTPAQASTPCEALAMLTIPDVSIVSASASPAGQFMADGLSQSIALPAFCRVKAVARPTLQSEIRFEVWIPTEDAWNGRFQGVGNGGYQGAISYSAMAPALQRGYAVASTDTGHAGDDLRFGQGNPERIRDWGWRAIHITAQIGQLIVRNAMGRFPNYSYFVGCSTGGHQALSEAQRFPGDYDGIIVGDPGYDRVRQTAAYLHSWLALHDATGAPLFTHAQLQFVTRAAVANCDSIDGVADGVIDDPRRCSFDPATLACAPGATSECLNAAQIEGLRQVYRGTYNPRTGERLFPGWSVGSEGFGESPSQGWNNFLVSPSAPMRSDVFRYFVFEDPAWDYRDFDFDRDMAYADAKIEDMAATDPDLSAFRDNGGRMLMYTGWADPVAAPMDVIQYYDAAVEEIGSLVRTQDFFRFFLAPGMGHCGGGPGPNTFDMLAALEDWVERGVAPEHIIASRSGNDAVTRTRPLCPYPRVARWTGRGDTNDAANFVCTNPPRNEARQ